MVDGLDVCVLHRSGHIFSHLTHHDPFWLCCRHTWLFFNKVIIKILTLLLPHIKLFMPLIWFGLFGTTYKNINLILSFETNFCNIYLWCAIILLAPFLVINISFDNHSPEIIKDRKKNDLCPKSFANTSNSMKII